MASWDTGGGGGGSTSDDDTTTTDEQTTTTSDSWDNDLDASAGGASAYEDDSTTDSTNDTTTSDSGGNDLDASAGGASAYVDDSTTTDTTTSDTSDSTTSSTSDSTDSTASTASDTTDSTSDSGGDTTETVVAKDPGTLTKAVDDTARRFQREAEFERSAVVDSYESSLTGRNRITRGNRKRRRKDSVVAKDADTLNKAVENANEQFSRENDIAQNTDSPEQFGDTTGTAKEIERFIDDTSSKIAEELRQRGEDFEQAQKAKAAEAEKRRTGSAPGTLDTAGVTALGARLAGELGEGATSVAADAVRTPSVAIEAAEAAGYLAGGTRIAGGSSDELSSRANLLADAGVEAGKATANQVKNNPEDFAAEVAVSAALTGGASLAARGTRIGKAFSRSGVSRRGAGRATADQLGDGASNVPGDASRATARIREDFSGTDRAQLKGPAFRKRSGGSSSSDSSPTVIGGDDIAKPSDLGGPSVGKDRTFEEGPTDTAPGDRPNDGVQDRRRQKQLRGSRGEGQAPPRAAAARMRAERKLNQDVDALDKTTQSNFFAPAAAVGGATAAGAFSESAAGQGVGAAARQRLGQDLDGGVQAIGDVGQAARNDLGIGLRSPTDVDTGIGPKSRTGLDTDTSTRTRTDTDTTVFTRSDADVAVTIDLDTSRRRRRGRDISVDFGGDLSGTTDGEGDEQRFNFGRRELL